MKRGEAELSACFMVGSGEEEQQVACVTQKLQAVPQPAWPAYSNIYDNLLPGDSN